jgi:F420-dependent oxidoreductase-like protein
VKLGIGLDLWAGKRLRVPIDTIRQAESLGYDSLWTAEAYGSDAITPLAYIAAQTERIKLATGIVQISARTPTATAMAMATLDALAGGDRVIVGLGLSGPQVVEGWYGQPWIHPLTRLRDTVAICRQVWRRGGPVTHEGKAISVPYDGDDATGMGKPLRSILHTSDLPIWIAAGGPQMVELAAEIADGWIPMGFRPEMMDSEIRPQLEAGLARRSDGRGWADFERAPSLTVHLTDDLRSAFDAAKPRIAMYVGGMGHPQMNFHNQSMARVGFPEAAARIQELFLAGRHDEATAAVPDDFIDSGGLYGTAARVRERWKPWAECDVTTIVVRAQQPDALELVAELAEVR